MSTDTEVESLRAQLARMREDAPACILAQAREEVFVIREKLDKAESALATARDAVDVERKRADALEAELLTIAEAAGYVNRAEGQSGYERATGERLAQAFKEFDRAESELCELKEEIREHLPRFGYDGHGDEEAAEFERISLTAEKLKESQAEVATLKAELTRVRPLADCYECVRQALGIDSDVLGTVATLKADLERVTAERDVFRGQVEACNATRYRTERDVLAAELEQAQNLACGVAMDLGVMEMAAIRNLAGWEATSAELGRVEERHRAARDYALKVERELEQARKERDAALEEAARMVEAEPKHRFAADMAEKFRALKSKGTSR